MIREAKHYEIKLPTFRYEEAGDRLAGAPLELRLVTVRSRKPLRRAVWRLATYFCREFDYDGVQYGHEGNETDPKCEAYIWLGNGYHVDYAVGACCFRWRRWTDAPAGWAMQWIWMHPFQRGQGHLTRAWPFFWQRYGDFLVEPPLSKTMEHFVAKISRIHDFPGVPSLGASASSQKQKVDEDEEVHGGGGRCTGRDAVRIIPQDGSGA